MPSGSGFTANQWRAEDYVGFVCKFMLGMGVGFELPVVVLTLVKIGVLNYRMLASGRRYVIVISAVLGAVLTTPEVITQILMAVPLYCSTRSASGSPGTGSGRTRSARRRRRRGTWSGGREA